MYFRKKLDNKSKDWDAKRNAEEKKGKKEIDKSLFLSKQVLILW